MAADESEITALLNQLSTHQKSLLVYYLAGVMSRRDSWADFANSVRDWCREYADQYKEKGVER